MTDQAPSTARIQRLNLPIDLAVKLTKRIPRAGQPCKRRNALKEYVPGQKITGVVSVTNHSGQSIPVERLLVSLEGFVRVRGERKLIVKRIGLDEGGNVFRPLKRYDWPFEIEISVSLDRLKCSHDNSEHLRLPPTIGIEQVPIDEEPVEIDPVLGYARISGWGGAVLVPDFAPIDTYVSYSVTVQLIGGHCKEYERYHTAQTLPSYRQIILQEFRHYVRVRTLGHDITAPPTRRQIHNLGSTYNIIDHRRILQNAADYLQGPGTRVFPWYADEGTVKLGWTGNGNAFSAAISIPCGTGISAVRQSKFDGEDTSETSTLVDEEDSVCVHVSVKYSDASIDGSVDTTTDATAIPSGPPEKLHVSAHLKVINMVSSGVPVSIDDEFMWRADAEFKDTEFENVILKDFFEPATVSGEWAYHKHTYVTSFDIPLRVSAEALRKKYYICPGFQTCNVGRWYQVEVEVGTKWRSVSLLLPLRVN